jgi:hypothetical protein
MRTHRRALIAAVAVALSASPTLAGERKIRLKFPTFSVPAHSDREVCTFVRLPMNAPYDAAGQLIVNLGGRRHFATHHFLMYAYTGTEMDAFDGFEGKVVDSKACLDFGPTDRNTRVLVGGAQSPRLSTRLSLGLAQQIAPNTDSKGKAIGFILNSHWINGDDKPHHAAVRVKFFPARKHTVKRYLQPIFEVVANGFIKVPPGTTSDKAAFAWYPGTAAIGGPVGGVPNPRGAACVVQVTAHMHKRGKDFAVDFDDGAGSVQRIFETHDYTDPGQWPPLTAIAGIPSAPMLVKPGQALQYRCTHDNGVTTVQKMGCEEEPGVTPGRSIIESIAAHTGLFGGTPKDCHSDADCAGFGTGRCVPANLVFGFTSNDDMCILPGAYYDANADAPAGQECDLGPLPVVN